MADQEIRVLEQVRTILKWPTDTVEIDYYSTVNKQELESPHTVLVFFPGNPGLVKWYIPSLLNLVHRCGRGFAARGVSYAGHGTPDRIANVEAYINHKQERDTDIPFTVDGQILHKVAYMDLIERDLKARYERHDNNQSSNNLHGSSQQKQQPQPQPWKRPRYIFLAHSIGCHMIQRTLVLRPDILAQTDLVLYITPFHRMKSDKFSELLLFTLSSMPETIIGHAQGLMKVLERLPVHVLDTLLKGDIRCDNGRKITIDLLQQPHFGRNFFELGMEEVRDLPRELPDVSGFRVIGAQCPTCILYVGRDKWAHYHIQAKELHQLQTQGVIPKNIYTQHLPQLVHDYVVRPDMVGPVDDFCFDAIDRHVLQARQPKSRL